jgi:DNA-binding NarL/FixJ family response regulator
MIRVLVVEDQHAFADALEIAIGAQPDLTCVGAVGTVEEAIPLVTAYRPDVVLMDIHLPDVDGIEGTRRITSSHPEIRVLVLTADATPELFAAATEAGAAGFLAKDGALPEILSAIRAPLGETVVVESATLAAFIEAGRTAAPPPGSGRDRAGLTAREREVLELMGEGLDPRAIAERLVVSLHTARGHVKNIIMKLDAHSQLEAVIVATRTGLLPGPRTRGRRR